MTLHLNGRFPFGVPGPIVHVKPKDNNPACKWHSNNPQQPLGGETFNPIALARPECTKQQAPQVHDGAQEFDDLAEEAWISKI